MTSSDMAVNVAGVTVSVPGGKSGGISRRQVTFTLVAAFIWLAVIAACMVSIEAYTAAPGASGIPPAHWPSASQIPLDPNRPTLVLFAHPKCPCTRATIGELNLLMTRVQGRVNAQVWFLKPDDTEAGWTNTDLWNSAAAIPGVTVHEDRSGVEAGLFQAETSGQTVLYSSSGELMFHGGITIARGHSGDNPGRSALADLVLGQIKNQVQTPVYGCSLFAKQCQPGGALWKP